MRKFVLLLFLITHFLGANAQIGICGFDPIHRQQLASSENRSVVNRINKAIALRRSSLNLRRFDIQQSTTIYEIPVVVHVIHSGEAIGSPYNPSDITIQQMIDFVNKTYSGEVGGNGVNIPIRFKLAQRSPDCAPTNGIVRIDGSGIPGYAQNGVIYSGDDLGASELAVKNLSRWPNTEYYNIWIVKDIKAEGLPDNVYIAAYAYFPGVSASRDGTIMRFNTVNSTSATLPHELGHAFALYHTFADGKDEESCSDNTDCATQGDMVCDTDPHLSMIGSCPNPSDINPCTGSPFGSLPYNIMNYGTCRNQFTQGQADRALSALLTSRESLLHSQGGTPPLASVAKAACLPPSDIYQTRNAADIGPKVVEIVGQLYNSSLGYSKDGYTSYIDNTCKKEAKLDVSNSYILHVSTSANRQRVKVWVDWNNSGTFDSTELVMNSISPTGTYIHSDTLTPAMMARAIVNTPLRMRVAADFDESPDYEACSKLYFGQMEDYTVVLSSTMPVRFGNITASKNTNNLLTINWATISEINTDHFEVQVSNDGVNFKTIKTITSMGEAGNSIDILYYSVSSNYSKISFAGLALILLTGITMLKRKKAAFYAIIGCIFLSLACNKKERGPSISKDVFVRIAHVDTNQAITYSDIINVESLQ